MTVQDVVPVQMSAQARKVQKPLLWKTWKQTQDFRKFFDYGRELPIKEDVIAKFKEATVKGSQFKQPLLEFSGACAGCGETPYAKLVTQLFGDRMYVANANRLLLHLGWFRTFYALHNKQRRSWSCMGKLPVRRQRRIWSGYGFRS